MCPAMGSGACRRTLIMHEERIKVHEDSLDGILFNGGVLVNFIESDSGIWEAVKITHVSAQLCLAYQ